jgi:hypothetical protein
MSTLAATRLVWGAVLIVAPGAVVRALSGEHAERSWRWLGLILGARHLVQALFESKRERQPGRTIPVVDGLHGASALSLSLIKPQYRRLGVMDALIAGSFAVWGWRSTVGAPGRGRSSSPVLIGGAA